MRRRTGHARQRDFDGDAYFMVSDNMPVRLISESKS
jgi:hypothetical protein